MSENVDLVRSILAAHERGDYGSADWADPDVEFVMVGGPDPGVWKGRAAMAKAWGDALGAFADLHSGVEEVRELDDERVLTLGSLRGTGKASGIDVSEGWMNGAGLYHLRDGQVIRVVLYSDRDRALADLGLEE
jgi:ketosteroid isomerase-like protein